jgi:predicted metal-binding protein
MSESIKDQIFVKEVIPVIDRKVRALCKRPYYNHPEGCPNFGVKDGCPPQVKFYDQEYDMTRPVYVIYNVFDFAVHVAKMRNAHPEWTQRQLECSRYWQGTARKALRQKIAAFLKDHPEYEANACPEAMGVNVTETMKGLGIELEWPPVNKTYQIALAGIRKKVSPDTY